MIALDKEYLRAMQLSADFLCTVPKFECEVAEKIDIVSLRDMAIPIVDECLVMRFNIRERPPGVADDVRVRKVRVGDEPAIFHKSEAER